MCNKSRKPEVELGGPTPVKITWRPNHLNSARNRQAKVDVEPNATSLIIKALKEPLREPRLQAWGLERSRCPIHVLVEGSLENYPLGMMSSGPWLSPCHVSLCFCKTIGQRGQQTASLRTVRRPRTSSTVATSPKMPLDGMQLDSPSPPSSCEPWWPPESTPRSGSRPVQG